MTFYNTTSTGLEGLIENPIHGSNNSTGVSGGQPAWYWIILGLISLVTVSGNGIVVFLILTRRNLRITCNWFVLSLCVIDFFVGLFLPWTSFICGLDTVSCNNAVFYPAFNTILAISVANTCVMTLDRYIGIVHALKYLMFMTPERIILLISASWVLPAVLALLPIAWLDHVSFEDQKQTKKIHTAAMLIIFEFLPPLVLLSMYLRIILTVRKLRRQTAVQLAQLNFNQTASRDKTIPNSRLRRQELSVQVIGAVVILFVICWAFDIYKSLCRHYVECSVDTIILNKVSLLFIFANSALNPIVYALLKRDIKTELKNLFRCHTA